MEVPATTLKAIGPAVRPGPLSTAEELAELYRIEINENFPRESESGQI